MHRNLLPDPTASPPSPPFRLLLSPLTPHSFHTRTPFTTSKPLFFVAERLNLVAAIKSLRQTHFSYVSRFGEAKIARIGVRVYRMSRMRMRAHPHAPVGTSTSFIPYSTYYTHPSGKYTSRTIHTFRTAKQKYHNALCLCTRLILYLSVYTLLALALENLHARCGFSFPI